MSPLPDHLPTCADDLRARGFDHLDVVLITGDANVDHPSFPAALLGRTLEAAGLRVGIIARPNTSDPADVARLGRPRLFMGVTAGALDSMVANTTALRKRRSDDAYAPGGHAGGRPDRALTVYCHLVRQAFGKQVLLVAGGLEASLRRFAHYDYWSDKVRRPILMDCGADLLVHGMGEAPLLEMAKRLDELGSDALADPKKRVDALRSVPGLVHRVPAQQPPPADAIGLPSAEEVARDARAQLEAFRLQEKHRDRILYQQAGGIRVIVNPPPPPPTSVELDRLAGLPYTRRVHPVHEGLPVPALEQVRFSVTSHRGCFGGCAFCAISAHQGRDVASRTREGILAEVTRLVAHPDFKGTINDIGGPTANMWGYACTRDQTCRRPSCLWPERCKHLSGDQNAYLDLLRAAKQTKGLRHLFVTTGLRMDLALASEPLIGALADEFTSGHLKVAPEHLVPKVLEAMRKPTSEHFEQFLKIFRQRSKKSGRQQYLLPYLMAAHPGSDLPDMIQMAEFLRREDLRVEQVQIFTPTPGTAATVMYSTGLNPRDGKPIFVERRDRFKKMQKALLLSHLPENARLVREALDHCGRADLRRKLAPKGRTRTRTKVGQKAKTKKKPRRR